MPRTSSRPRAEVIGNAGSAFVEQACTLLHRAFAEYSQRGRPSGALRETPESLRAELAGGTRLAIARVDDRVVAMVKHRPADDGSLYFSRLAVDPDARGHGLVRLLLDTLRVTARHAGLRGLSCAVRAEETGNIAIYEHLGMRVTGRERRASLTGAVTPVVLMADA